MIAQSGNREREGTPEVLWVRPGLRWPDTFDTLLFDIDGVLIENTASLYASYLAVAEYVVGTIHGLEWREQGHERLFQLEDIHLFQTAGCFNNYHDMAYLLSILGTARLREWKRTPLGRRSTSTWALLARAAHIRGMSGLAWIERVMPQSARLDYERVGELYREYYWGTSAYQRYFGQPPRFINVPGFVHLEALLFQSSFPSQLRALGIPKVGLITGRDGPEVQHAQTRLRQCAEAPWWDVLVSADDCPKPDPRALRLAIEALSTRGGLYLGDTAADCDLVYRYRSTRAAEEPEILIAMCVRPQDVSVYQQRGVDLIVSGVEGLLDCLSGAHPRCVKEG